MTEFHATQSQSDRLSHLAATVAPGGTILMVPAAAIERGDMLLAPCVHAVEVKRLCSGVTVTSDVNAVHLFAPDRWLPLLRPADPTAPCSGCGGTWLEGCVDGCDARVLFDEDVARALTGQLADAPPEPIPPDSEADLVAGITAILYLAQTSDLDPAIVLAKACRDFYDHHPAYRLVDMTGADRAHPAAEVYAAMHFNAPLAEVACDEALGDLIADVCHLAIRYETEAEDIMRRGERHFTEEHRPELPTTTTEGLTTMQTSDTAAVTEPERSYEVTVHTSTRDGEAFAASLAAVHAENYHDRTSSGDEDGYCQLCTFTVIGRYPEITDDTGENLTEDARIALLAVPRIARQLGERDER